MNPRGARTEESMRAIEKLLGKTAEDEKSDLDEAHIAQMLHALRAHAGEHGAKLAEALEQERGDAKPPQKLPKEP